jgi:hypothetical protein
VPAHVPRRMAGTSPAMTTEAGAMGYSPYDLIQFEITRGTRNSPRAMKDALRAGGRHGGRCHL